jgi:hypothetical protein
MVNPRLRIVALPKPALDTAEARRLNATFYGTEPHTYFQTRLILLMVAAADPDAINAAVDRGLEYGSLKRGRRDGMDAPSQRTTDGNRCDHGLTVIHQSTLVFGSAALRQGQDHPRKRGRPNMTTKDKVREEIDAAIARIDAKLAFGSDQEEELQEERRNLETARNNEHDTMTRSR